MNTLFRYIVMPAVVISFMSCKKDNYKEPGTLLTGSLMYKGDSINVERSQVPYQIYQYGLGSIAPVGASSASDQNASPSVSTYFAQNGSYSQVLFNGNYKLIIPNGQGPFIWKQDAAGNPDSLAITLEGNQTVNLEVTPYYMVRNTIVSASGGTVTASFQAEKIITDPTMAKDIERVSLYINSTQFTSGGDNIAVTNMDGSAITDPNNISLSVAIPAAALNKTYVYARVGIKIVNVEDMIFSPLEIVQL